MDWGEILVMNFKNFYKNLPRYEFWLSQRKNKSWNFIQNWFFTPANTVKVDCFTSVIDDSPEMSLNFIKFPLSTETLLTSISNSSSSSRVLGKKNLFHLKILFHIAKFGIHCCLCHCRCSATFAFSPPPQKLDFDSNFFISKHTQNIMQMIFCIWAFEVELFSLFLAYKFSNINANCWKSDFKLTICLKYDWVELLFVLLESWKFFTVALSDYLSQNKNVLTLISIAEILILLCFVYPKGHCFDWMPQSVRCEKNMRNETHSPHFLRHHQIIMIIVERTAEKKNSQTHNFSIATRPCIKVPAAITHRLQLNYYLHFAFVSLPLSLWSRFGWWRSTTISQFHIPPHHKKS